jgi:iron complex transport system permease protein
MNVTRIALEGKREERPDSLSTVTTSVASIPPPVRRARRILGLLALVGLAMWIVCLQFGAESISVEQMGQILLRAMSHRNWTPSTIGTSGVILLHVRLPRLLLSFLVGGCLAGVGTVLQALLRNPLADPHVLGVSSGAAFGASLAILLGIGGSVFTFTALPLCGFAGGLLSMILVYCMAAVRRDFSSLNLLLAGIMLNAMFTASIMFITSILEPNRAFGMMSWLMGSLTAHASPGLLILSLYLVSGLAVLIWHTPHLNILALGDDVAHSLGVDPVRVKRTLFLASALVTGAAVSVSGMIGFVGMVVPHAVRIMVGADNRLLLPASVLVGGTFLMAADTIARTILAPTEMPVGIITALCGGPFFVYLFVSRRMVSSE